VEAGGEQRSVGGCQLTGWLVVARTAINGRADQARLSRGFSSRWGGWHARPIPSYWACPCPLPPKPSRAPP
jgi:hypothetical protein